MVCLKEEEEGWETYVYFILMQLEKVNQQVRLNDGSVLWLALKKKQKTPNQNPQ